MKTRGPSSPFCGARATRETAQLLERGQTGLLSRVLASAWAPIAARGLVRPLNVPPNISARRIVCVGGATLGGSGKTRVAIACADFLARSGASVALVGHAYRASPGAKARIVQKGDSLAEVGDEALVCARAFSTRWSHHDDGEHTAPRVVVAKTRQAAIDFAAQIADVIVVDGPLRIAPTRTSRKRTSVRRGSSTNQSDEPPRCLSLLAVDAVSPWGHRGRVPPAGDLRAPRDALLMHADHVVSVDATPTSVRWVTPRGSDEEHDIASLQNARIGLFTAMARPDRLVSALARIGIHPRQVISTTNHGPISDQARAELEQTVIDTWVATEKCALHLPYRSKNVGILTSELLLPSDIQRVLVGVIEPVFHG